MKYYMIPATVAVDLNGEKLMVGVENSAYNGEAAAPARESISNLKYL